MNSERWSNSQWAATLCEILKTQQMSNCQVQFSWLYGCQTGAGCYEATVLGPRSGRWQCGNEHGTRAEIGKELTETGTIHLNSVGLHETGISISLDQRQDFFPTDSDFFSAKGEEETTCKLKPRGGKILWILQMRSARFVTSRKWKNEHYLFQTVCLKIVWLSIAKKLSHLS